MSEFINRVIKVRMISPDNVDDQFCSDFIKLEIKRLFSEIHTLRAQLKIATEALEGVNRCVGYSPEHLGAENYEDPGIKMAQEIIKTMRWHAEEALIKIQEMGK